MEGDEQTVPLADSYMETVTINGRDYHAHAINNGAYFTPIDEIESERLRIQHDVFTRLFDGRLIFPPIRRPRRVLECGFGTASWAMEVAEAYPNCEVIGLDLSPHMAPEETPENLILQVDDLNQPYRNPTCPPRNADGSSDKSRSFTFRDNHFDLVHSQMVAGGIHANRWRGYLRDMHRVLRPGGWCQLVEIYFNVQSDNGSLTDNHALSRWSRRYMRSVQPYKDPRAPLHLERLARDAGFVEIETRFLPLPLCGWSNDPREHDIGTANRENIHRLLSSLAIFPFTEYLRMAEADFQLLVAQARAEADNPAFKAYFPV